MTNKFMRNPKYRALLTMTEPMPVSGGVTLPSRRRVLYKKVRLVSTDEPGFKECLIEMSRRKLKFYILALDLEMDKFHVLELWLA